MSTQLATQATAVIYARYSSANQREESIDAQIRAIREYAEKNKITILEPYYIDRAKSATSARRPEFQQMIKDSQSGKFDYIIVHKLDRFTRDKYDSAIYKNKLKKNGIRLLSVTERLDGSPEAIIMESMLEGMAHYYSANLAREVSKGLKETALQCRHTGGTPALGFDVDDGGNYIINEEEAKIIRAIFRKYLDGYGYNLILSYLDEKDYKTKRGNSFSKTALYSILNNEKYTGVYLFNQVTGRGKFARDVNLRSGEDPLIRIEGGMPTIIQKEDFAKVQEMLKQNKRLAGSNKAKVQYLLTGVAFCGHCGSAMQGNSRRSGRNKTLYKSYRCGCRANKKMCNNKEIRKEYIEEFVLDNLEEMVLNDAVVPKLVERINEEVRLGKKDSSQDLELYTKRLTKLEQQVNKIVDAISEGISVVTFKAKLERLEHERSKVIAKIESLKLAQYKMHLDEVTEEEVKILITQVKQFVIARDIPECKRFIKDYINRIDIYTDHVEVTFNVAFSMSKYLKIDKLVVGDKEELIGKYTNELFQ